MATYGGDEVSALVVDCGSQWTKVGYAGEDTPRSLLPSDMGVLEDAAASAVAGDERAMDVDGAGSAAAAAPQTAIGLAKKTSRKTYIGSAALSVRRDGEEVVNPIKNGLIDNWDLAEALWDHAFAVDLRVNIKEHPVLMAEPTHAPRDQREKLAELFFEKYDVPGFYLCKTAVLSAYQAGKPSALVIDCGAGLTSVTPVNDGYVLKNSSFRQNFAGNAVTDYTLAYLEEALKVKVHPRFLVSERKAVEPGKPFTARLRDFGKTTASYHAAMRRAAAADFKESIVQVTAGSFQDDEAKLSQLPTKQYEFPDGFSMGVGIDRFRLGELFYQPSKFYDTSLNGVQPIQGAGAGGELLGIHTLVSQAISQCDPDLRSTLLASTLVTGGSTLTSGFVDRLGNEMAQMVSSYKYKISAPPLPVERRFAAWIGGSILASLGSFHQMWVSKQEYDESGRSIVEQKCP